MIGHRIRVYSTFIVVCVYLIFSLSGPCVRHLPQGAAKDLEAILFWNLAVAPPSGVASPLLL